MPTEADGPMDLFGQSGCPLPVSAAVKPSPMRLHTHVGFATTQKEAPAQGSAGALLQVNCWLRGQRHDGSITRQ